MIFEALPGLLGNMRKGHLLQGNKCQMLRAEGNKDNNGGTGNIRKQIFDFGVQGNNPIYFRGTGATLCRASFVIVTYRFDKDRVHSQ